MTQTHKDTDGGNNTKKPPHDWLMIIITFLALVIALVAANYTRRQADIAEDTARRQLRAYLGFETKGVTETFTYPEDIVWKYYIINHGQTPAKKVHITGQIEVLQFPLIETFVPTYSTIGSFEESFTTFPGEDTGCQGGISAKSHSILEEIKQTKIPEKNLRCYLFAQITYVDCFDTEHHTSLCMLLDPPSINYNIDGTFKWRLAWVFYTRYNDFD